MTPNHLFTALKSLPADAPLIFETEAGPVAGGYHVTELKHATIKSIDCGARLSEWTEASLQVLDGQGGSAMTVGKFTGILAQSIRQVTGLGESPLHVEFAPKNVGMRIYQVASPEMQDGQIVIRLTENRAQCKPAMDVFARHQAADCCPSGAPTTACCS
ncbi:MAG: DUF6428 family protein [Pseudomonadota bacterium]